LTEATPESPRVLRRVSPVDQIRLHYHTHLCRSIPLALHMISELQVFLKFSALF
jgi:hypothetical protein